MLVPGTMRLLGKPEVQSRYKGHDCLTLFLLLLTFIMSNASSIKTEKKYGGVRYCFFGSTSLSGRSLLCRQRLIVVRRVFHRLPVRLSGRIRQHLLRQLLPKSECTGIRMSLLLLPFHMDRRVWLLSEESA